MWFRKPKKTVQRVIDEIMIEYPEANIISMPPSDGLLFLTIETTDKVREVREDMIGFRVILDKPSYAYEEFLVRKLPRKACAVIPDTGNEGE